MPGTDGNETCPSCYLVLIDLADFDARDDMFPVDRRSPAYGMFGYYSGEGTGLLDALGAYWKQWRLTRVLRRFPRSLYCPYCGYIRKLR